ncbi:MAG TPA: 1-deoxy-D-xylulose-5-phosphate synthase [Lutibacter sp.]|nr:1-deoxy-D-xylulose-5-phosphate synthase [Lutibacter sp.]
MNHFLSNINKVTDLRKLTLKNLPQLAQELRAYIIDIVATKKGHLGAGLGVIELTIALHYIYNTPEDLLIWDVGHQAYAHKILTGRRKDFITNRQLGGISGFPKRSESKFDVFGTGHSSTSISAVLGMAIASQIKGEKRKHIAVIGDASIASGMAFEALNHAGVTDADILIILNDNQMGIDPHVGALKEYLTSIKSDDKPVGNNIFQDLNLQYFGPIDGHDIEKLTQTLTHLKTVKGPKFLHIITTKGKGLPQAEKDQVTYHAPGIFDKKTGIIQAEFNTNKPPKYQDVFGLTLVELAQKNKHIVGITAAMPTGTSLKYMLEAFPTRTFDVGIAEQHAVTFAGGLATQGFVPYFAVYSTFLQRAYDQVIHDIALQNLPVVFCIDRAGIVGNDGATHHGIFDIAFLRAIPNMIIAVPKDEIQLRNLLYTAQFTKQPFAIRYPRGRGIHQNWQKSFKRIEIGKGKRLSKGNKLAILSIGHFGNTIQNILSQNQNLDVSHYDMLFVKPLDEALLHQIFKKFDNIITLEDGTIKGGFGSAVLEFAQTNQYRNIQIKVLGIPDQFIEHGSTEELFSQIGLDEKSILKVIQDLL